jgi:ketopantoate reductase
VFVRSGGYSVTCAHGRFEKAALLTAVQDLAHDAGVQTPIIDMVAALLQGLERNAVLSKL